MMAQKIQNPVVVLHKVTDEENNFTTMWYDIEIIAPMENLYAHLSDEGILFTIGDSAEENKLLAINGKGDFTPYSNQLKATLGKGSIDRIEYIDTSSRFSRRTIFDITKNLQPTS